MKSFRFSLRLLILLVTAVGLFLGYSQYRRQEILKLCAELKSDGYVFSVPDAWHDRIWQRKPIVGVIRTVNQKETLARAIKWGDGQSWGTQLDETTDPQEIARLKKLGMVALPR